MKLKLLVYLALTLVIPNVKAETKYILIDAGCSKKSNYAHYYNSILTGYELLKDMGKEVSIMAKNGKWSVAGKKNMLPSNKEKQFRADKLGKLSLYEAFAAAAQGQLKFADIIYPNITSPASNLEDLEKVLSSYKNGDTLYLFLTGHGGPPTHPGHPESATVGFLGNDISYHDLANLLKKFPNLNFKIHSGLCYAGGVHHLTRSLNNVCASSVVPYFSLTYPGSDKMNISQWDYWKSMKSNSNSSLGSLSLENTKKDFLNHNLGSISSLDYVDFVLKKGAYEKTHHEIKPKLLTKTPYYFYHYAFLDNKEEELIQIGPSEDYSSISFLRGGEFCTLNNIRKDTKQVQQLSKTLNKITEHVIVQNLINKTDQQPPQIRTVFHDVIDDMKQNRTKYSIISKSYQRKNKKLSDDWKKLEEICKNRAEKKKPCHSKEKADILNSLYDLHQTTKEKLKQYSFNVEMLDRLGRLDEFSEKATPEQKEKFLELLKCEWEPL